MVILQLLTAAISALLLGAHFLRSGQMLLVLCSLSVIVLLWIKSPWAARLIQIVLLLGTIEWIRTTVEFVSERMEMELPYTRLIVILGGVAAFTCLSALLIQTRRLKQHFRLGAA